MQNFHKVYLHELLKQDQEPFQLQKYIADKRSQLNKSPHPHHHDPQPISKCPNTASVLLLESATRIKKKQGNPKKPGLFSSVFKKFKEGSCKRSEAERNNHDQLTARVPVDHEESSDNDETATFYCSCNFSGRPSSGGGLSEDSNGSRTSSWRSENSSREEEIEFVMVQENDNRGFRKRFWSSPFSPSRFSPSSGQCSAVLTSPAISPCLRKEQVEVNSSAKVEEKEQYSPVSVLKPQLEIEHEDDDNDDDEHQKQDYDFVQSSFRFVDKAKEQLLYKLRRFEKLANLDPVELEKRMVEQLNDKDQNESRDDEFEDYESMQVERRKLRFQEEKSKPKWLEKEDILLSSVCRKMDCCLDDDISMTIDMMVQMDFKNELDMVWKRCQEQREESCMQIELAIIGLLVEEVVEDLMESMF